MEMDLQQVHPHKLYKENELLYTSLKLFGYVGLQDPLRKIYLTAKTPDYMSLILTLTLMNQVKLLSIR